MTDIATLGLAIDSRQAVTAAAALDGLARSAAPAAAGFSRIQAAAQPAVNTLANVQRQTGLVRHEMINLSRQVQDVGVSLASGQSPLLILVQQGTQIADIFASSKGSVGGFAAQLRGMISPTVLAGGGIIALGAAAYGAMQFWKGYALQLDDTARVMDKTAGEAAKLQAAASFKGIGEDEFAANMKRVATNVYDANNGMGDLAELFRANNVQARTFNEYLEGVANLVQRAGSYEQKNQILRAAGIAPTAQWVRLLENGADGLRRATAEAANFGGVANDQLVRKAREFDESWNRAWTNFGLYARSAITDASQVYNTSSIGRALLNGVTAIPGVGPITAAAVRAYQALNPTTPTQSVADRFPTAGEQFKRSGSAGGQTTDPNVVRDQLSKEQQRIGLFGQLVTVQQAVRQQEIAIAQARLNGVKITESEEKAILAYTRASALGTIQIRQQADAYRIEAGTIGLGVGAAASYRAEQERLADARLKGQTLSKGQVAEIQREATALGVAAQRAAELRTQSDLRFATSQFGRSDTEQQVAATLRQLYGDNFQGQQNSVIANQIRLNFALAETKSIGESALSGLARDLRDGKSAAESLNNALSKITDRLIDIAANKIMSGIIGGITPGGGGGFSLTNASGLYHSGRGPGDPTTNFRYVHPAYFENAPRFHSGIGPGELPAIIRKDESVLTPGQMKALGRMGGGGGAVTVNVMNAPPGTTASASTSRDGTGGMRVDVWLQRQIDDTGAAMVETGESAMNRAFERRYGLTPKL